MTSWLELLLRDASVDELEQHRRRLQASDDTDPERLEVEARQALQLSSLLRERAQRAAELAVLSEIATRLTSVRDLPELLTDIARHARQLLRTDVAYLAIVEGDSLRVRFFDGAIGPGLPEVRLSMTAGLAGRIAATGRASWTSDYLTDTSIQHHAAADAIASEERLQSILGVPLRANGVVFGVLFAAERSSRPFADHEISLLAGLAGHAAVAIENARLFDAERAAAEEVRSSAVAVARAITLHDRITGTAVSGGGPAEVVDALAEVLGVPVQLLDADDVALVGPDLAGPQPSKHFAAGTRRTLLLADEEPLALCPVVAGDDYLGCLAVRGPAVGDDSEVRLLERGALAIALSLAHERAVSEAAIRSQGELLGALVDGGEAEMLERRAAAVRMNLRKPHVVAVADADDAGARSQCISLVRRHSGLVTERSGHVVLLVAEGTDLSPLAACATVGVSAPVTGAAGLPAAYSDARRSLLALLALDRRHVVATGEELGLFRFVLAPGGTGEAATFVARTIGPLLEHDATRGTELVRTLEAYLDSGRQHGATAERLHIHSNTLYQRLTRIGAVLGEDWRDPDRTLELHVAVRLHRTVQAINQAET